MKKQNIIILSLVIILLASFGLIIKNQTQINALNDNIQEIQYELDLTKGRIYNLESSINDNESTIQDLESNIQDLESRLSDLEQ